MQTSLPGRATGGPSRAPGCTRGASRPCSRTQAPSRSIPPAPKKASSQSLAKAEASIRVPSRSSTPGLSAPASPNRSSFIAIASSPRSCQRNGSERKSAVAPKVVYDWTLSGWRLLVATALVLMAAGMGSRFGGLKQVAPVGPSGETLLDYSVFDARRAGFDRLVFVIRRDIEKAFREAVGRRFEAVMDVAYAFQETDALPAGFVPPSGRTKPWGTGQAVLSAADVVSSPFAVANADDFYGASSYRALASFLRAEHPANDFALVSFRLSETLSEHGSVARGICEEGPTGFLRKVTEVLGIEARDGAIAAPGRSFAG